MKVSQTVMPPLSYQVHCLMLLVVFGLKDQCMSTFEPNFRGWIKKTSRYLLNNKEGISKALITGQPLSAEQKLKYMHRNKTT